MYCTFLHDSFGFFRYFILNMKINLHELSKDFMLKLLHTYVSRAMYEGILNTFPFFSLSNNSQLPFEVVSPCT